MGDTKSTNLNIRIDKDVKIQAENLLSEMGMSISTAVYVFIRQLVREGGIPFLISVGNNSVGNYNLPYIRSKLSEAELQRNDPTIKRLGMEEVMDKYQEKYGYEL